MQKQSKFLLGGFLCSIIIFINLFSSYSISQTENNYWPGDDWIITTPEDQGMNSNLIGEMYDFINQYNLNIQSILVSRNGYIVNESYLSNSEVIEEQRFITSTPIITRKNGSLHVLYSCTKSIISLLIGIAIEKGYIDSVNETFFGIFPDKWKPSYGDELKKNITIEDLLTMRSGLQWDEGFDSFSNWWIYNISLDYVLKKPLVSPPSSDFEYSSGNTQLLSAIIQNKTGMKTSEFAQQHLFAPIGIKDDQWEWDEINWEWGNGTLNNISYGGWGLYFTPKAMARIGLLCLNNGNWNSTQVVPESYITSASINHVGNPEYGYLFWLKSEDYFYAAGYLGQYIIVIPDYDIVVIIFSESTYVDYALDQIINDYIIESARTSSNPQIPGYNLLILLGFIPIIIFLKIKRLKVK